MDIRNHLFGGLTRTMVYRSLDAGTMRAKSIANNLANVMTPEYQRKEVNFEKELQKVYDIKVKGQTTQKDHMEIGKEAFMRRVRPQVYEAPDPTLPGEVNNVDVDLEAAKLAENQILYNYAIHFAGFKKYLTAISGQAGE